MSVALWNLGPGRFDFFPRGVDPAPIPVALAISKDESIESAATRLRHLVSIGRVYTHLLPSLDKRFETFPIVTGHLVGGRPAAEVVEELSANVDELVISPPLATGSYEPLPVREEHWLGLPKAATRRAGTVVLGIIDDGIAFAHDRFTAADGTRVEAFWMQDGPPPGPVGIFGPFTHGRELSKTKIDALRTAAPTPWPAGLRGEDELYLKAGVTRPDVPRGHKAVRLRRAHGTHVLDVALSSALAFGAADVRVIGVQLPIATTGLQPTADFSAQAIEGLVYILMRSLDVARRLESAPLPVAVNLSYGITNGPHDGGHILERFIDLFLPAWTAVTGAPCEIVVGAGNSYLERLRARLVVPPSSRATLGWRIQPDDRTPSLAEVWLPPGAAEDAPCTATLKGPHGGEAGPVSRVDGQSLPWTVNGEDLAETAYKHVGRGCFTFVVAPTARTDLTGTIAPAGLWSIHIENESDTELCLDAYVARDVAPFGYPQLGRQSYFDETDYRPFDEAGRPEEEDNTSPVQRMGSINGIGTGRIPSVIGGYVDRERLIAPYSAGSSSRTPDAAAVCDDSKVLSGVLAGGTHSGSIVALNGTSVAAPVVTGWVCYRLSKGLPADRAAVQDEARTNGIVLFPPYRAGAGGFVTPLPRPSRVRR
ncbi:hypothetical protein [Prosthecomicrobium sp. N25]|uniref:hypothetical protein n=1 Tax=Prosthecomicrobium sp. N25 TaxID=3129254 RepID=UPI0030786F9D